MYVYVNRTRRLVHICDLTLSQILVNTEQIERLLT